MEIKGNNFTVVSEDEDYFLLTSVWDISNHVSKKKVWVMKKRLNVKRGLRLHVGHCTSQTDIHCISREN